MQTELAKSRDKPAASAPVAAAPAPPASGVGGSVPYTSPSGAPTATPAAPSAATKPAANPLVGRAAALIGEGKAREALPLLDQALAADPRDSVALKMRLLAHGRLNQLTG